LDPLHAEFQELGGEWEVCDQGEIGVEVGGKRFEQEVENGVREMGSAPM
jgi:hypothetical protein